MLEVSYFPVIFSSGLMNLCLEVGWNIEEGRRNYRAMACHSIWNWKNKEKHNDSYSRPYNPASVVRRSLRNYHLAVNAITTQRENQSRVSCGVTSVESSTDGLGEIEHRWIL